MGEKPEFSHDVYVSYSSRNARAVRAIVKLLTDQAAKVWFDDRRIDAAAIIPRKVHEGLQASRVLLYCLSRQAANSAWVGYELNAFIAMMNSPPKNERQLLILRLDGEEVPEPLQLLKNLDWSSRKRADSSPKLLAVCRSPTRAPAVGQRAGRPLDGSPGGHPESAPAARVEVASPDGQLVARSYDRTIEIGRVGSSRKPRVLRGHTERVECLAWTIDGTRVLSGSRDRTVCVWNVVSGRCSHVLRGHGRAVLCLAAGSDPHLALSGSRDRTLRLWDLESGLYRTFTGHHGAVTCVAWNANPRFALTGSVDASVRLWDLETGECLTTRKAGEDGVRLVVWQPDQRHAHSSDAHGAHDWDLGDAMDRVS